MHRSHAAAVALLVLSAPHVLAAQTQTGAIRGRISDAQGHPLRGAEASLSNTTFHATSDSTGAFLLGPVPAGRYALVVRGVGFEPKQFTATVFADDTIEAPIVLQSAATTLDPVIAQATNPARRRLEEFATMKRTGIGTLFDSTDIAKHGADKVSDLLRTKMNGLEYWPRSCGGTAVAAGDAMGGPVDLTASKASKFITVGGCCAPNTCYFQVFVDGIKTYSYDKATLPPDIDGIAPLPTIEAIEVFKSGSRTPPEYNTSGSACGTISIWLKR